MTRRNSTASQRKPKLGTRKKRRTKTDKGRIREALAAESGSRSENLKVLARLHPRASRKTSEAVRAGPARVPTGPVSHILLVTLLDQVRRGHPERIVPQRKNIEVVNLHDTTFQADVPTLVTNATQKVG